MPNRSRKKRPRDLNLLAKSIVDEATGEEPQEDTTPESKDPSLNNWDNEGGAVLPTDSGKDPAENPKAKSGRLGGLKGGKARAEKLTPEQRREIAEKAARARWSDSSSST